MRSLPDMFAAPERRSRVVDDCCILIDEEVDEKSGLAGIAIKAGYKAVKGIKPDFLRHAVDDLLPEFAHALDPLYQEAKTKGMDVEAHFRSQPGQVAEALLSITDTRAAKTRQGLVKATYDKLRGMAKKNV